jgi:hypothetical protein
VKVSPAQLAARCPCMDALWPVDCSAATRIRVVVRVCVCVSTRIQYWVPSDLDCPQVCPQGDAGAL